MKPITLRDAESRTLELTGECVIERPVKPQPTYYSGTVWSWRFPKRDSHGVSGITGSAEGLALALREYSPLGQPGEQRWCRETFAVCKLWSPYADEVRYKATLPENQGRYIKWRSPITMPRWASRATVEILDVKVEHGESWDWIARARRVE